MSRLTLFRSALCVVSAFALFASGQGVLRASPMAAPPNPPVEVAPGLDVGAPQAQTVRTVAGKTASKVVTQPQAATAGPVSTWIDEAENLDEVVVTSADSHPKVQSTYFSEGAAAFNLANPAFADEMIQIAPVILPTAQTKLYFEGMLGYATSSQVAKVEVSTNSGSSWTSVWSLAGTSNGTAPTQSAFALTSVSLGAYAGQNILVRFRLDFIGGSAFTQTTLTSPFGWFIDNVQIGTSFTPRLYSDFGDPTAKEVLILEYINRARADAVAEAARLRASDDPDVLGAISFFNVDLDLMQTQFAALTRVLPPLAMNGKMIISARLHSQDMFNNQVQQHDSTANPVAPNQPGDTPGDRLNRQGYSWTTYGENIYAYAENPWHAHAGFEIDWGSGPGGMQDPAGHRSSIHSSAFREIGVGCVEGTNGSVGPLLVTQDFGVRSGGDQPFLVGVTLVDQNQNSFYDLGEGLGEVSVTVDGSVYYAISSMNGCYAVPLPGDGTYAVTFSKAGYLPATTSVTVSAGKSVKLDYLAEVAPTPVTLEIESVTRPVAGTVRIVVVTSVSMAGLSVESSADLTGWNVAVATASDLGGGRVQLDLSDGGATKMFYRVTATQ